MQERHLYTVKSIDDLEYVATLHVAEVVVMAEDTVVYLVLA
jgi:hypothetical protein